MHERPLSEGEETAAGEFVLALPAAMANVFLALEALDRYAADCNLERELTVRLRIIVEELFTNTIKYGHGGDSAELIQMRLRVGERTELIYEDTAPGFDPLAWYSRWQSQDHSRNDNAGQRGIALILGLAADTRYQATGGGNRLILTMRL